MSRGRWFVTSRVLATAMLLGGPMSLAAGTAQASPVRPAAAMSATGSDLAAQTELAGRYAPVVQQVDSPGRCGLGEPFEPLSVNVVLGNPDVALRGPWSGDNVVQVAPTAQNLSAGLAHYNLDFPGNALSPGCSYARWAAKIQKTATPTVYAHVVTQSAYPDQLALQYWFFYLYNDFNDRHEGDWEMIQIDFHAADAEQALATSPYDAGYSQHEGAERVEWGTNPKLELVDGTHPAVYPALGSHANYYSEHLYLGHSAAQGVGCDDTLGPSRTLRPAVVVIPQSSTQAVQEFPWLAYQGRWGERHHGFDNGPTGPSSKARWTEPFTWADTTWRSKAFAIPDGGLLGQSATSFFCTAVAKASSVYNATLDNPPRTLIVVAVLLAALVWLASRTQWGPANVYRVRRRRSWGSMVTSAVRMYWSNRRTFLGIGLLFVPLGVLIVGVQFLLFDVGGLSALSSTVGDTNPAVLVLVDGLGVIVSLLGLTAVQAATAYAVVELDEGRAVTATVALRHAATKWRTLLPALAIAVLIVGLLSLTLVGTIIGAYLVVRWSLLAQSVMLGDGTASGPLRQSFRATRHHFWRTASVTIFVTAVVLLIGPLIGSLLLFATDASFDVVNLVAAVIEAILTPLVAITTTYLYFDLKVRTRLAEREIGAGAALPAEA